MLFRLQYRFFAVSIYNPEFHNISVLITSYPTLLFSASALLKPANWKIHIYFFALYLSHRAPYLSHRIHRIGLCIYHTGHCIYRIGLCIYHTGHCIYRIGLCLYFISSILRRQLASSSWERKSDFEIGVRVEGIAEENISGLDGLHDAFVAGVADGGA